METITPKASGAQATHADGAPLLRVEDLRTTFHMPTGAVVHAVDGVSLTLNQGETLGIVGESGSGKSVFARTVMNLVATDPNAEVGGAVYFEGRDVHQLPKAERKHFWGPEVAMVFQDPMTSLNPVKKIGTLLSESMRFHLNINRSTARTRALELLNQVGIPEPERRLRQYPHELSGGMRQRVVIAMALACDPKLLIADEPTTALDVTVQRQILDLLAEITERNGMTTIIISHDLGVVAGRTERIAVMYAGRVVETAPTLELFSRMRHPYTEALLESVPKMENAAHTRLSAISGRPPDLTRLPLGCNFAPRCRYAQESCLTEDPRLRGLDVPGHEFACHYPVGTEAGQQAYSRNEAAGTTAAGLSLHAVEVA